MGCGDRARQVDPATATRHADIRQDQVGHFASSQQFERRVDAMPNLDISAEVFQHSRDHFGHREIVVHDQHFHVTSRISRQSPIMKMPIRGTLNLRLPRFSIKNR